MVLNRADKIAILQIAFKNIRENMPCYIHQVTEDNPTSMRKKESF